MKLIKVLLFAVCTVLMVLSFAGTGVARAENISLCSNDSESCSEENQIKHTHYETTTGKIRIIGPITVECFLLFLTSKIGILALLVHVVIHGPLVYAGCGSCEVQEENGPGEAKFIKEGHETASVTFEFLMHVVCSGFIDCSFNGAGLKGIAKGSLLSTENGEISVNEQKLSKEVGGFLCPSTTKLSLAIASLTPIHITR